MFSDKDLPEKIHEANVTVHRTEAKYYELIHPEVYGRYEQKRIFSVLKKVENLLADTGERAKKALDFGSGTGNITGKLLEMGYEVTAVDISAEMCKILEKKFKKYSESKKLVVINSPIEDVSFEKETFDLVTCYSVLHHLPDYIEVLQMLSFFLRKGGVMYIDHELSPFYWRNESSMVTEFIKLFYFHSNPLLNTLYFGIMGVNVPSLDYGVSDYWHQKEHPLNHREIESLFAENNYVFSKRVDYHHRGTWFWNPIFYIYSFVCKPEMSFWLAKK